jgi:hypothetical protein
MHSQRCSVLAFVQTILAGVEWENGPQGRAVLNIFEKCHAVYSE